MSKHIVKKLMVLILMSMAVTVHAETTTLRQDAAKMGHAVGQSLRKVGLATKKVAKQIGHGVRDTAKTVGHAAKAGGREFKRAIKGESKD